jgi:hypothetical protein
MPLPSEKRDDFRAIIINIAAVSLFLASAALLLIGAAIG